MNLMPEYVGGPCDGQPHHLATLHLRIHAVPKQANDSPKPFSAHEYSALEVSPREPYDLREYFWHRIGKPTLLAYGYFHASVTHEQASERFREFLQI